MRKCANKYGVYGFSFASWCVKFRGWLTLYKTMGSTKPVWQRGQVQGETKKEDVALHLSSFITPIPIFFLLTFLLLPPSFVGDVLKPNLVTQPAIKPPLMSPCFHPKNTFYNNYCVNMEAGRHDCRSSRYFLSHVNICKGEVWKVWDSLLLSKKMCHLDAEGWKRVAGCEHLIWIISSSRLQFSLLGQMDWDFLCQCWISKSVLPGHSQPL